MNQAADPIAFSLVKQILLDRIAKLEEESQQAPPADYRPQGIETGKTQDLALNGFQTERSARKSTRGCTGIASISNL